MPVRGKRLFQGRSSFGQNQAGKGVDSQGPSRRAVAWGVATRGQGKLSGESEAKAPEQEPDSVPSVTELSCASLG